MNDLDRARLRRHLPNLPNDYLEIATTWDLGPLSIGYFNLNPPSLGVARELVDRLIVANTPVNPLFGSFKDSGMLQVASYEGDPLLVGAKGSPVIGQVFRLSASNDQPQLVAPDFGALLKAATQLDDFRAKGATGDDAIESFLRSIEEYIPATAIPEWTLFADHALQPT
ncbi:MAG TPA: hypothetical protein VGA47_04915 [Candidatus Dormibacteraeota bacterium]